MFNYTIINARGFSVAKFVHEHDVNDFCAILAAKYPASGYKVVGPE